MQRVWGSIVFLGLAMAQTLWVDARAFTWEAEPFPPRRFPACYTFARFDLNVRPPPTGVWLLSALLEEGWDSNPATAPELELRLVRADGTSTPWMPLRPGARVDQVEAPVRYHVELRACFSGREWPGNHRTRLTWMLKRAP